MRQGESREIGDLIFGRQVADMHSSKASRSDIDGQSEPLARSPCFRSLHHAPPPRPVVLVSSLDWIGPGDSGFGLGPASIASALHGAGVKVRIVSDAVNRPGFRADDFFAEVVGAVDAAGADALVGTGAFVGCDGEIQRLLPVLAA